MLKSAEDEGFELSRLSSTSATRLSKISGQDVWVLPIQESFDVALLTDAAATFS
jgi:hypothetical protein